jgi:hypothetical protein
MRRISNVNPRYQAQDVRWIVLEEDASDSGGVFLYLHRDLNEACLYDCWFETIEQAEQHAWDRWGISKGHWESGKQSDLGLDK